jgi:hypothetical protein
MTNFDYDPLTFPGPALPASCYRALHSYVLEAVMEMTEAQRHDLIEYCQGMPTWGRFMLTVFDGRLTVDVIPEATTGAPWLWVHYPRQGRPGLAYPIVAVAGTDIGADPDALKFELALRMQGTLERIVDIGEAGR